MILDNGSWTLGVLIGVPVLIVVALILVVIFIAGVMTRHEDGLGVGIMIGTIVVALTIAGFTLWGYWPLKAEYHKWYSVSGTVETTNKRLISTGEKGMSERYVIKFKESSTLFGCDDTRCAIITPGKTVSLKCKKEWQYQSTSGWACRYNQED